MPQNLLRNIFFLDLRKKLENIREFFSNKKIYAAGEKFSCTFHKKVYFNVRKWS